MSLPGSYVSGIRTHYNSRGITILSGSVFSIESFVAKVSLTVAWNIEEIVSFLSAKCCLCVFVFLRVPVCVLAPPEYRWSIIDTESTE